MMFTMRAMKSYPSTQPPGFFNAKSICLTLIAFGMGLSVYLLWRHSVLDVGNSAGFDMCLALFGKGCDAALMSPAAFQFGLPVAGWGLTYFATLAVLLLLGHFLGEAFEFEASFTAFLLSLVALLLGLVLIGMMLSTKGQFCPLCAMVHLINLALVFSLKRLTGRSIVEMVQALSAGGRYLMTGKTADPVQARWKLLGLLTVMLVAAVLYQRILLVLPARTVSADRAFNPKQLLAAFEANAAQDIPVGTEDPILGPLNAPIQLIVFSEFQCPACRRYSRELHTLLEKNAPKLQIVFKHFPLNKACNPTMKGDLHPRACEAAYAAEAARRQGKFWPFHDKLFEIIQKEDANIYTSLAQSLGLDLQRFEADCLDEATKAKVRSDIDLGARLDVHGTPTLFLNRRRVLNIHPQAVQILLDKMLATPGH